MGSAVSIAACLVLKEDIALAVVAVLKVSKIGMKEALSSTISFHGTI